jgi:phage FluMu protein Com
LIPCPIANCEGYASQQDVADGGNQSNLFNEESPNQPLIQQNNDYNTILNINATKRVCNKGHSFCIKCNKAWHMGSTCEADREIVDFATTSGFTVKKCPRCKVWTEKNSGCNHMTCQQCQFSWCWLCESECGPEHYNTPGTPCYSKLFEGLTPEEIRRMQEQAIDNINMFTFFIVGFILTIHLAITTSFARARGQSKILFFFCFSLMMSCFAVFLALTNFIFLVHIAVAIKKVSLLRNRSLNIMTRFTGIMLLLIFYLPGMWITFLFYFIAIIYTLCLLCNI